MATPSTDELLANYAPSIPGATENVTADPPVPAGQPVVGVPLSIFVPVADGQGVLANAVKVTVPPPIRDDGTGDDYVAISLWLNGVRLEYRPVDEADRNRPSIFDLFQTDLLDGRNNLLEYKVVRESGNTTDSDPLWLLYSAELPGGNNVPGNGDHPRLTVRLPAELGNPPFIGRDDADAGVPITLDYPFAKPYDVITLQLRNERFSYTVQPGDARPYVTTATRAMLVQAGNNPVFPFSFTVADQLGNTTDQRRWSAAVIADVDVSRIMLELPVLREILNDVADDPTIIDHDKLRGRPLNVVVVPREPLFREGDTIEGRYIATPSNELFPFIGTVERDPFGLFKPSVMEIPNNRIISGNQVRVSFSLIRSGAVVGLSKTASALVIGDGTITLPIPAIREASGAQGDQLNPNDVYPEGATVVIGIDADLKTNDEVIVLWRGRTTEPFAHRVLASEAGKELDKIKIPHATVVANDGQSISLTYTVIRNAGGTDGPSAPSEYDVRKVTGPEHLLVMGARHPAGVYRHDRFPRLLSVFNAVTGEPVQAEWQYAGDSTWQTAATWRDTEPQKLLRVRKDTDWVTLNPANIFGSGAESWRPTEAAFVAHRDIGDVVGWGHASYGGVVPGSINMSDVVEVSCSHGAYAVRRIDGKALTWGRADSGGDMGPTLPTVEFVSIRGSEYSLAGLKRNGQVVAWGGPVSGGTVPDAIARLTDIRQVFTGSDGFVAQRAGGQVVAWGDQVDIPDDIGGLTDIQHVIGSIGAFAALRANNRIVGWGKESSGGVVPQEIAALSDVVELCCAGKYAFAAKRATGQIVAWGSRVAGGVVPQPIADLRDIVEVSGNSYAFAARRSNGRVVSWGREASGGLLPDEIGRLDDVVQVVGTGEAFAALRKNGTVAAWGASDSGGTISSEIADQLVDVRAIYANLRCFLALTADGRVVTWGDAASGGDSSGVQDKLRGQVSYYATPGSRGLALATRARHQEG